MTDWNFISNGSVWEDADILCHALEPVAENGRLLSVASAGDSVLALLTLNPEQIVAVDGIPSHLHSLELRIAAYRLLDYESLLQFLGVTGCRDRMVHYFSIRHQLSEEAALFWDRHTKSITEGIIHSGTFEHSLHYFTRWILPLIHAKWKRETFLQNRPLELQKEFYKFYWNSWLWKWLYPKYMKKVIDPNKNHLTDWLLPKTQHILTEIPSANNPFLCYLLTDNFRKTALPRYLRPEHYETIKTRLDRIQLLEGPVQQASGKFDGFNLSTIFDSMSQREFNACYEDILNRANEEARIAYWNQFNSHTRPNDFVHRAQNLKELSQTLSNKDKVWFYRAFQVDDVVR